MKASEEAVGLTTTKSSFIEDAKNRHQLFIHQPYELYSADNQRAWKQLYTNICPVWRKYANRTFLDGLNLLSLTPCAIPNLNEINKFLAPLTGFAAIPVSGYVPPFQFFECLKNRKFPTTITIRESQRLNYIPEPDIFHDVAGHVPMHTDKTFADVLVKFGSLAERAVQRHAHVGNIEQRNAAIYSNIQALSRFFWFTVEFGLIREGDEIKVYGSGLLSSAGEIMHCIESQAVQRFPFQLEWVINQSFEIDHYQPLLFIIESFEHLYQEVNRLEEWLLEGKLDQAAPGEPKINTLWYKKEIFI